MTVHTPKSDVFKDRDQAVVNAAQPLNAPQTEYHNGLPAETAAPSNIVIFGASGDLSKRKLIPSLIRMLDCGLLHPDSRIIGLVNRRTKEEWIQVLYDGLVTIGHDILNHPQKWAEFAQKLALVPGDLGDLESYTRIAKALQPLGETQQINALFYCAIPPAWYKQVAQGLHYAGLTSETNGYRRIVVEKPFGTNLESSQALNSALQTVFKEQQIYRIDHYLGKESVQNLLVFRFANGITEPLWNRNYIDNVQINVSETLGIEYRAPYYEKAGALRDMIQSHLMQVMTLVAMEPPVEFTAKALRDEKIKVLRAVRRFTADEIDLHSVAAQYGQSAVKDNTTYESVSHDNHLPYTAEPGVSDDSLTETFAAVRFHIDNWRWQGVPFILTSGKRLPDRVSEVVIRFKKPPFNLFNQHASQPNSNALIFRLQPDSGIFLQMNVKKLGATTDTQMIEMHAPYELANQPASERKNGHTTGATADQLAVQSAELADADNNDCNSIADAYEVLLHDVLMGDGTLFSAADEVNESWAIVEPILNAWQQRTTIERYAADSWQIPGMDELTKNCLGGWYPSNSST